MLSANFADSLFLKSQMAAVWLFQESTPPHYDLLAM